jgi:hypothetical protein
MGKRLKCSNLLMPREEVLDTLRLGGLGSPAEIVLTDRRVLVSGPTDMLGAQFSLVQGTMIGGFGLTEFQSFVIGSGRRPWLFMLCLALGVGGGAMFGFDLTRLYGLVLLAASILSLLAWTAWSKTFLEITAAGLKLSGVVRPAEAVVFVERLLLASQSAKAGKGPEQVQEDVRLAGRIEPVCEVVEEETVPPAKRPQ